MEPTEQPNDQAPTSSTGRSGKWLKPPRATRPAQRGDLSEAEKIRLITNLDSREQRWGYVFAGLTVLLGIVVLLIGFRVLKDPLIVKYTGHCPLDYQRVAKSVAKVGPKDYVCVLNAMSRQGLYTQLILQLGVALAIFFTARRGKRSALLMAIFLGGLSFGTASTTFALLYLAFGAFLLIRSSRLQRETGGRVAQAQRLKDARDARRAGRPTPNAATAAKAAPKASKRYTPKGATRRSKS